MIQYNINDEVDALLISLLLNLSIRDIEEAVEVIDLPIIDEGEVCDA